MCPPCTCGDPCRIGSVRFETHDDHRDGIGCTVSVSPQVERSWIFTQCPSTKVTLCTTQSFAWLVVIARGISEKLCYNGVEYDTELTSTDNEKTCELPDGNVIIVGA